MSPLLTDPWMDAAMAMRARASDMHRAAERRMLACRPAHATSLLYMYVYVEEWIKCAVESGYTYHHRMQVH